MSPKTWRRDIAKLTLESLSKLMDGISVSYLSRVERGLQSPSGNLLKHYHKLSGGAVGPADFKYKKEAKK